jgi:hypothetical protein
MVLGLLLAAASGIGTEVSAALCDAPESWPGAQSAEIEFTGVSAYQIGMRGDGPNEPAPVSLNSDVLGLGGDLPLVAGGLVVKGSVVCVRHRPEWLALRLANTGTAAAAGLLRIGSAGGVELEAEIPRLEPGEVRRVLIMAGEEISAFAAESFSLSATP